MLARSTETRSSTNHAFRILRISKYAAHLVRLIAWVAKCAACSTRQNARAFKHGLTRLSETHSSTNRAFRIFRISKHAAHLVRPNRAGSQICDLLGQPKRAVPRTARFTSSAFPNT